MNDITFSIDGIDYTFSLTRGQILERQSSSHTTFQSQVSTDRRNNISHSISSTQTDYHSAYILNKEANREERIHFAPNWDPSMRTGHDVALLLFKGAKKQKNGKAYKVNANMLNACCALTNNSTNEVLWGGVPFVSDFTAVDFFKKYVIALSVVLVLTLLSANFLIALYIFAFIVLSPLATLGFKKIKAKDNSKLSRQVMDYLAKIE